MSEKIEVDKTSAWQRIFAQSKVNGGPYIGEHMPRWPISWPRDTWLQRRLKANLKGSMNSEINETQGRLEAPETDQRGGR